MKTLTVEFVKREDKTSKTGKPFTLYKVVAEGVWYSCFENVYKKICSEHGKQELVKGDEITVTLIPKEWNGKTYYDIAPIDKVDLLEARVAKLEALLKTPSKITIDENKNIQKEFDI